MCLFHYGLNLSVKKSFHLGFIFLLRSSGVVCCFFSGDSQVGAVFLISLTVLLNIKISYGLFYSLDRSIKVCGQKELILVEAYI